MNQQNDYFQFGEFYSDVYTIWKRIEKIEVIKVPVLLFTEIIQSLGVVNIITRKTNKEE